MVVLLWVGSSVLSQYIFDNSDFGKPMFMTCFNSSLFSVYLLGFFICPNWRTDGYPDPEEKQANDLDDEVFGITDGAQYEVSIPLLAPETGERAPSSSSKGKPRRKSPPPPNLTSLKGRLHEPAHGHGHNGGSAASDDDASDPLLDAIAAVAAEDHDHAAHHECGSSASAARIEARRRRQQPTRLPWPKVAQLAAWCAPPPPPLLFDRHRAAHAGCWRSSCAQASAGAPQGAPRRAGGHVCVEEGTERRGQGEELGGRGASHALEGVRGRERYLWICSLPSPPFSLSRYRWIWLIGGYTYNVSL
jgi:hypothetical protein